MYRKNALKCKKLTFSKKKAKKIMSTETPGPGSKGFERWPLAGRKIRGQRDLRPSCGSGSREIAILAAGAAFPDMMDSALAGVSRDVWKGIHRTVSHWPVLYPAILDFVVFFGAAIPESVFRLIFAFLMGALVHISCDFLIPMGITLYPSFTKRGGAPINTDRLRFGLRFRVHTDARLRACLDATIYLIGASGQARKRKEYTSSSFSFPFYKMGSHSRNNSG
ncbi:MAG: metal-dependent hydrolase [Desulfobacteraceae bacterium]|nr:metal-dependent hydrolase [Clostridiales bacterium]MCF8036596.1 metal-dependent hydrolase [Desulfobacteraceae bacterium]